MNLQNTLVVLVELKNKTERDTFMINQRALILDKIKQIQVKYNSKTFDTENRQWKFNHNTLIS